MKIHNKHKKYIYNIPYINKQKLEVNELGKKVIELNKNINEIINIFKIVLKNIIIYYNICNDYIQNYDMKMMNYEKIGNMNKIINEDILNDIKNIINDNNINNKIKKIIEIYYKIKKEEILNKILIKNQTYDKLENRSNINNEDVINVRNNFINNDYLKTYQNFNDSDSSDYNTKK